MLMPIQSQWFLTIVVSCGEGESPSIWFGGVGGFTDGLKIRLETSFGVESVEELHQVKKSF